MLATVAGVLTALTLQTDVVTKFALTVNPETNMPIVEGLWRTLFAGFEGTTSNEELNRLISKGGIASMLNTVWLIVSALAFGGVLERTGILQQILDAVLKSSKVHGRLGCGHGHGRHCHKHIGGRSIPRNRAPRQALLQDLR